MVTLKRIKDVPNYEYCLLTERETDAAEWFGLGSPLASLDAVLLLDVRSCE